MSEPVRHPATLILSDIDPVFVNLAKRLQQVARLSGSGLSIINLSVFLFDGKPVQYTRPEISTMITLEPKGNYEEFCDKLKTVRK
jgi:hypothetical protein